MPAEQATPIFRTEEELARLPASERIRYRLVGAECRYHANDNIAAFIADGELDELKAEVEAKMHEVLRNNTCRHGQYAIQHVPEIQLTSIV